MLAGVNKDYFFVFHTAYQSHVFIFCLTIFSTHRETCNFYTTKFLTNLLHNTSYMLKLGDDIILLCQQTLHTAFVY